MKTKKYNINGETLDINSIEIKEGLLSFELEGEKFQAQLISQEGHQVVINLNGRSYQFPLSDNLCRLNGKQISVERQQIKRSGQKSVDHGGLLSPMPGKILKLAVSTGEHVKKGTTLLVMEAMKMEHSLKAPCDCTVDEFFFKEGQLVEGDVELVAITPQESP